MRNQSSDNVLTVEQPILKLLKCSRNGDYLCKTNIYANQANKIVKSILKSGLQLDASFKTVDKVLVI
jgi:hypothetical protein